MVRRSPSLIPAVIIVCAHALGCTIATAPADPTTTRRPPLINGDPTDAELDGVLRVVGDVECSGFLITNQWAITARHCISSVLAAQPEQITVAFGGTRSAPAQTTSVAEVQRSPPGPDLAMLRLSAPLNVNGISYGYLQREYPQSIFALGQALGCTGWGSIAVQYPPPEGPTTTAGLLLDTITPPLLGLAASVSGTQVATGDAGGPCTADLNQLQPPVGLMAGLYTDGASVAIDLTPLAVRSWLESQLLKRDPDVPARAASIPHAASPDGDQINIFWIDDAGQMNQSQVSPDTQPVVLGGSEDDPFASDRPAAAYVQGDLHILARTVGGRVLEGVSHGGAAVSAWTPVAVLPAIDSGLGIVSRNADEFDVFARSLTGPVTHAWFSGGAWVSSELIGGFFDEDVLAVWDHHAGGIDVFGVSLNHVSHKGETEAGWIPAGNEWWTGDVTGDISSACAAVQVADFTYDLFARGTNGHLVHKAWANGWGDQFADLGVAIPGEPSAVVAGGAIHIFARNSDGTIWHAHLPR